MEKCICFLLMTAVLLCAFVSCGKKPASKESSSVVEPTKETDETTAQVRKKRTIEKKSLLW